MSVTFCMAYHVLTTAYKCAQTIHKSEHLKKDPSEWLKEFRVDKNTRKRERNTFWRGKSDNALVDEWLCCGYPPLKNDNGYSDEEHAGNDSIRNKKTLINEDWVWCITSLRALDAAPLAAHTLMWISCYNLAHTWAALHCFCICNPWRTHWHTLKEESRNYTGGEHGEKKPLFTWNLRMCLFEWLKTLRINLKFREMVYHLLACSSTHLAWADLDSTEETHYFVCDIRNQILRTSHQVALKWHTVS